MTPREELEGARARIVAEGSAIEAASESLAAVTAGVVTGMDDAPAYEGWADKYIAVEGPSGHVGHHSRPEALDGFIFNTGTTRLDARVRGKMAAYEALLPGYRENNALRNVDNTSFFDIESTGVGAPYMNFFGFMRPGTDGRLLHELGATRIDYFGYAGPADNPGRGGRWTPIIISLYGNLSPALLTPVYRSGDRYWGFFDVHWDVPGLMDDVIGRSPENLMVVAHDPEFLGGGSVLIGINGGAMRATGLRGFVRGSGASVEQLALENDPSHEVRELAARVKARESGFEQALNGRRFKVHALHEPSMLLGFTVIRLDEVCPGGGRRG